MILDTGVFIALENPAQRGIIVALLEKLLAVEQTPQTTAPVLAQAWRDPARQVAMTRLVKATTVHPFGDPRVVGLLCGRTDTTDVVDADLAVLAHRLRLPILTTDPVDMTRLGADHVALPTHP